MGACACMYNGNLKGKFSSVPSCCINSSLTPFLLIPHPRNFLSGMLFNMFYVFGRIWVDIVN